MSAMRLIQEARTKGNKIDSFVSFCGGLPAPEFSNGLLGYKFSFVPPSLDVNHGGVVLTTGCVDGVLEAYYRLL